MTALDYWTDRYVRGFIIDTSKLRPPDELDLGQ